MIHAVSSARLTLPNVTPVSIAYMLTNISPFSTVTALMEFLVIVVETIYWTTRLYIAERQHWT